MIVNLKLVKDETNIVKKTLIVRVIIDVLYVVLNKKFNR